MTELATGVVVSHYRIVRRLGAGGMGSVYLAEDLTLDRHVAIKFLAAVSDEQSRRRLLREARSVAALDHEGIAAVYEVGEDPAYADFIVMQYVEGETLAARLQRGRLPAAEALALAGRVAEALVAAHRRGVVHRDLKPQNIMITPAGTPRLLDFGLAIRASRAPSGHEVEVSTHSATTRGVAGTPAYMSPEQARNQELDGRSDVFALGCVLYECLTGRRAFTGANAADIIGSVLLSDPPPPSTIVPDLGPAHDALCARLLKKSTVDRFQSAEEALGAIHALTDTERLAGRSRGPRMVVAATLLVAALAGAWIWSATRTTPLPVAPVSAQQHYDRGVAAMRDGTYAGARDEFNEALRLFPDYVQALYGLAHASKELDDDSTATRALGRVSQLVPDRTRLPDEERLRLEAVQHYVLHSHDEAVAAYKALADRHPDDAGAWLDLGLATEAAGRRDDALRHVEHALAIDPQLAAAHLRRGVFLMQEGRQREAFAALDEAVRLYRIGNNVEGEAEALLRKGIDLTNGMDLTEAHTVLTEVLRLAGTRYMSQRVRARFELARVGALQGRVENLIADTDDALREAVEAGLFSTAANGRVDAGIVFMLLRQPDRAQAELEKAIQSAKTYKATVTEMRAQLQLAGVWEIRGDGERTLELAAAPLEFFTKRRRLLQAADAKILLSRGHELQADFRTALSLSQEVLAYADDIRNEGLASKALQNLAYQSWALGHLPEMLSALTRTEGIYRRKADTVNLPGALLTRAEALIALGRGAEAEPILAEIEADIRAGRDSDVARPRRIARLRAYRAVTEGRFAQAGAFAAGAEVPAGGQPDSNALAARILAEYARTRLGRPGVPAATLVGWLEAMPGGRLKRDMRIWAAHTLLDRGRMRDASPLIEAGWADRASLQNPELRWRMAALAEGVSATIPARSADRELNALRTLWAGDHVEAYSRRADVHALLERISMLKGGSHD